MCLYIQSTTSPDTTTMIMPISLRYPEKFENTDKYEDQPHISMNTIIVRRLLIWSYSGEILI